ncbi:hypothetical protein ACTL32_10890 [Planococcus sp. FY231025]|uniref:hypothetical protein n=1 Tax=Planococcus sp. FY231025 TaxID=3455699 RepID=UPI003F90605E
MKKIGTLPLIGLAVMAVLSFANFSGSSIAGLAVIVGIIFFFVAKKLEKQTARASGLDFRSI